VLKRTFSESLFICYYEFMKPLKHAVSVIIRDNNTTLFALRSADKERFPLTWSMPSYFVKEGEAHSETVKRIGKDKLGVDLELVRLLNEGYGERDDFLLFMHDYEAKIVSGTPYVNSDDYIQLEWREPNDFLSTLQIKGECTRLYDEYLAQN